jgi:hypothetical protein
VFCKKPCATRFDGFCKQIELGKANSNLKTLVDYVLCFGTMEQRLKQMVSPQLCEFSNNRRNQLGRTDVSALNKDIELPLDWSQANTFFRG